MVSLVTPSDVLGSLDSLQKCIVAVLGAKHQDEVPGKLWLQKEIYVLSRTSPKLAEAADYAPYLQGPWSENVEAALEDLQPIGLVKFDSYGRDIQLTDMGHRVFSKLASQMPEHVREHVEEVKEFLNDMTEEELLVFTYYTYKDMIQESVKLRKAIEHRREAAESLYRKDKVSLEKAAELAGMRISDFRREVTDR
jgi:predicted HTH domain antitoxin